MGIAKFERLQKCQQLLKLHAGRGRFAMPIFDRRSRRAVHFAIIAAISLCLQGTYAHAQRSKEVVKIGVLVDMSGLYSDLSGIGSVVAAQMAAEDFGGTVLGKKIEIISADHQNKPDIGASIAEHGGIDACAGPRRTSRNHMLDTCYFGGRDRHDGRGEMGVTPAGHVAPGGSYRNVAMSCDQSRHEFDFSVEDGGALRVGEAAHLIVGEGDIVFEALR
jgi:Periplasmic binding protein